MIKGRKTFFFEKKKQKTFALTRTSKSFLLLFFKKEGLSSLLGDDGFTLMEIIIAVVVMGFILAGLSQATRFGITAWNTQERLALRVDQMERVDRVLRNVIEQATPPLAADDKPFAGQEHRLVLTTRLPDQPQTDPIRRAQVAIGVDGNHRLLLRWTPHANAVALKKLPPPEEIVLAEGVDHLDLSYRQSLTDGGKWMRVWEDSPLPALVTLHILFQDAHRTWPVLQVATMLDTNGSF
jgi:general secretion pathway protein J